MNGNYNAFYRASECRERDVHSATGKYTFSSFSDATALSSDPSLELSYIVAPPRMLLYANVSTQIFSIYSTYVSPEDVHVYSIDEVFMPPVTATTAFLPATLPLLSCDSLSPALTTICSGADLIVGQVESLMQLQRQIVWVLEEG